MTTSSAGTDTAKTTRRPLPQMLAVTFGVPVAICLMLWAFLAPSFGSGPSGVPIAIAAPEPVQAKITSEMEQQEAHPDLISVDSSDRAKEMVQNREAVDAVVIGKGEATVYEASGNGSPYVQMLDGMAKKLKASGTEVKTEDLAPLTEDDPQASGISMLGLPLAFGGIISAVLSTFLLRGHKWMKLFALAGIAALGAGTVVWMLHGVYGTLDGNIFQEWLGIALGIAATSTVTAGLAALIGTPGIAIGAVLTIFVGNPLSGLATGPWLLPAGWSTLGQLMPIGSTGFLIRSISYFDGAGATRAWSVLVAWVIIGLLLLAFDRPKPKLKA